MTKQEAKQKAIQEAYGEFWKQIPNDIQNYLLENNGLMDCSYWIEYCPNLDFERVGFSDRRPKSLQGIENNNGWTSVKDKLPTIDDADESGKVLIFRNNNESQKLNSKSIHDWSLVKHCDENTLWMKMPKPPIY